MTLHFFTNYCNFWHRIYQSHADQFNGAGRRRDGRCVVMLAEERNDKYNCNSVSTSPGITVTATRTWMDTVVRAVICCPLIGQLRTKSDSYWSIMTRILVLVYECQRVVLI